MYSTYVMFVPATGEIIGWLADHEAPKEPGYLLSPTGAPVDGRYHYVREGKVVPRPGMSATFGDRRLNSLPVPCRILINGKPYDCNESSATLEFTYSGRYKVEIEAFPFMNANFEVST